MLATAPSAATLTRRIRRLGLTLLSDRQRARLREMYESATAPRPRIHGSISTLDGCVSVTFADGLSFRVLPAAGADMAHLLSAPNQAAELAAFLHDAPSPGLLFDIGANNGAFALVYCHSHAANRAVAFEPSPVLAERLDAHARLNGLGSRQVVVRRAVGEAIGSHEMLVDTRSGWVQVQAFAGTARPGWINRVVEVTTIDAEAARLGSPSIIKIDVEGYELEALRGAARVLSTARPVLFLELHLNYLEERRIDPQDVLREITRHGYHIFTLAGARLSAARAARSWASVLHLVARPR